MQQKKKGIIKIEENDSEKGRKAMTYDISASARERLLSEELMTLDELSKVSGITKWKLKNLVYSGLTGASKKKVRLERVRTECGPKTSVRAVERLRKRLNDAEWNGRYE